jgi:DNA polymerase I
MTRATRLDLQRALLRGRYSGPAVSAMQHEGVPVDAGTLRFVLEHWEYIIDELIARIHVDYGVYEGRTFKEARFEAYLAERRIPWDRTAHGHLKLDDNAFAEACKTYPILEPLRNLRHSLGTMRLNALPVGKDGRNRTMLRQFAARTGRNQPSSAEFIFSPGVWLRGFIAPPAGYAISYVDWSAAEFEIAAKLSEDPLMMSDYEAGDPHLEFAKEAGAVPSNATKASHGAARERFKSCNFGILYGMGQSALARPVGDDCSDSEAFAGGLQTMFGWHVRSGKGSDVNPRSMRNFPIQAGCAEIMRVAACLELGTDANTVR